MFKLNGNILELVTHSEELLLLSGTAMFNGAEPALRIVT
jgi:hypothetical protein